MRFKMPTYRLPEISFQCVDVELSADAIASGHHLFSEVQIHNQMEANKACVDLTLGTTNNKQHPGNQINWVELGVEMHCTPN